MNEWRGDKFSPLPALAFCKKRLASHQLAKSGIHFLLSLFDFPRAGPGNCLTHSQAGCHQRQKAVSTLVLNHFSLVFNPSRKTQDPRRQDARDRGTNCGLLVISCSSMTDRLFCGKPSTIHLRSSIIEPFLSPFIYFPFPCMHLFFLAEEEVGEGGEYYWLVAIDLRLA
jgi:hypothetical protein